MSRFGKTYTEKTVGATTIKIPIIKTEEQIKRNVECKKQWKLHWTNFGIVDKKILEMRKSGLKINEAERMATHIDLMTQICACEHCEHREHRN